MGFYPDGFTNWFTNLGKPMGLLRSGGFGKIFGKNGSFRIGLKLVNAWLLPNNYGVLPKWGVLIGKPMVFLGALPKWVLPIGKPMGFYGFLPHLDFYGFLPNGKMKSGKPFFYQMVKSKVVNQWVF